MRILYNIQVVQANLARDINSLELDILPIPGCLQSLLVLPIYSEMMIFNASYEEKISWN